MKYKYIFILIAALLVSSNMSAQRRSKKAKQPSKVEVVEEEKVDTPQVVKNYNDSLTVLRQQLDSIQRINEALRQEVTDGRYFRLFAPTTF